MARNKEFDEEAVLLKAMRLFWEQGYEKTSMQELVSHMGIHKRSMYDTFGDKQSLYVKALKRYSDMVEQLDRQRMVNTHSSKEAIRQLFEMVIRKKEDLPTGCFLVNSAVELATHDSEARDWVCQSWNRSEQLIYDLIVQGQHSGELSKTLNAEWLSCYFNNSLIGLRVMVKTTTDREKLHHIIDMNLSVLE